MKLILIFALILDIILGIIFTVSMIKFIWNTDWNSFRIATTIIVIYILVKFLDGLMKNINKYLK